MLRGNIRQQKFKFLSLRIRRITLTNKPQRVKIVFTVKNFQKMEQNFILPFLTNKHDTNFSVLHWLFISTRALTEIHVLNTKRKYLDFLAACHLQSKSMFILSSLNLLGRPYYYFFLTFIFPEGLDLCSCIYIAVCMVNARKLSQYVAMPVTNAGTSIKNKGPTKKELRGCTASF